ncbi:MAG TPA: hypothetical protein VLA53_03505 [Nitrosopumilaceae archaeon]|nr:hypothetical protein [Nitrosopumilaceae archaeon]
MIKIILVFVASIFIFPIYGMENIISDANIDVTINYPDVVTQGNEFVLSSVVKTKADQVSNITISISSPEIEISQNQFNIQNLPRDSTLGNNFNMKIKPESPDGRFLTNVSIEYFIKGFFDEKPVKNTLTKAIEFNVQSKPMLLLDFDVPDSVFAGEVFSVKGTIRNQGYNAQNIKITTDSEQVTLGGKKIYSLTNLGAGKAENFEFILQTQKDLTIPTDVTINVSTSFFDERGKEYAIEDSLKVFARQRGILEIGGPEGIWVGNFFIAPVVGVGTIVSSVIGFLIFVWHLKNKKKQKEKRK